MNRLVTTLMLAGPQPGDYDPSTGKGPEWGKAAPIGLLIILLLGVALYFLLRSFTRQLKKVPASFDPPAEPDVDPTTGSAFTGGADGADAGDVRPARVPAASDESDSPPPSAPRGSTRPADPSA